jgi:SNF2 family DNA or RNA helicase
MISTYEYKTKPYNHQDEDFTLYSDKHARGHLWEMGTGKSKPNVDAAGRLFEENKIDGLLVVAPNGVHRNWIVNEIPTHMPDRIFSRMRMHCYSTEKSGTQKHDIPLAETLAHRGLAVLAMSYDAMNTKAGKKAAWDLLRTRKCMYIADEGRRIKTPGADRTKAVLKSSIYAPYRRLLNGTPITKGPFDLYSQMLFLDQEFWKPLGIQTFTAFKQYFGVFVKGHCRTAGGGVREFPQLVSYKNLDILKRMVDTICTRVTKDDVLNLPPKLYSRLPFQLNTEQKRVYDELSEDFMTMVDGNLLTAPLVLTRLLRLQQITSGFVPVEGADDDYDFVDLGKTNPRLEVLESDLEDIPHKAIIWCRFRRSIDKVMDMLGKRAVRYDGTVKEDGRAMALDAMMPDGHAEFMVANAQTAGEGLTIIAAKSSYYYENTYNLGDRLQSEDRNHRIGQDQSVNYKDIIAEGTADEHVVDCNQKKMEIASQITGDKIRTILTGSR